MAIAALGNLVDLTRQSQTITPQIQAASHVAERAVDLLAAALQEAEEEIDAITLHIQLPGAYDALGARAPAQIAAELSEYLPNTPGNQGGTRGALVVAGRVYWLNTRGAIDHYHGQVVPQALVGRFGFTNDNYNHIEASAAAILRRLALQGGVDLTQGVYVVVNQPRVCGSFSSPPTDPRRQTGCYPNLTHMLPHGVRLTVYPSRWNGTQNVIFQPNTITRTGA